MLLRRLHHLDGGANLPHVSAVFVHVEGERVDDVVGIARALDGAARVNQLEVLDDERLGDGVGLLVVRKVARDLGDVHRRADEADQDDTHGEMGDAAAERGQTPTPRRLPTAARATMNAALNVSRDATAKPTTASPL